MSPRFPVGAGFLRHTRRCRFGARRLRICEDGAVRVGIYQKGEL